ncbi:MAG TPA: hypothetical protein H9955_09745 [Candidatus Mediterraneibacter cottocaccae]|nr:hypothetical protein [Candidatus Mediterraneibacter cottocaccae]
MYRKGMKIVLLAAGLVFGSAFLTGCGEKEISGTVAEQQMQDDIGIVSFVVESEKGDRTGVLMTDETSIISWADGVSEEDFKHGRVEEAEVTVTPQQDGRRSMTTADGDKITAYNAERIEVNRAKMAETEDLTLSDGTPAEYWRGQAYSAYRLKDGTELLTVEDNTDWDYMVSSDDGGFIRLGDTAKEKIKAYFDERGELYSIPEELEKAYSAYQKTEDKDSFQPYVVGMEIAPVSYSEKVIYFRTNVTYSLDESEATEYSLGDAFDRETGEKRDTWDLFSCDEETAKKTILELSGLNGTDRENGLTESQSQALIDNMKPEYVVFEPSGLAVYYPKGTLDFEDNLYALVIDYDERLCGMLHDWAAPVQ